MNTKATGCEFLTGASTAIAGGAVLAAAVPAYGQTVSPPGIPSRHLGLAQVDVLEVRGGPANIGAALGASRRGVKALRFENRSVFERVAAWPMGMQIKFGFTCLNAGKNITSWVPNL